MISLDTDLFYKWTGDASLSRPEREFVSYLLQHIFFVSPFSLLETDIGNNEDCSNQVVVTGM